MFLLSTTTDLPCSGAPFLNCSTFWVLHLVEGTHLALATHSMVTSEVPATTLVFLGGMMMVGAMGSAGPPTSGEKIRC